MLIFTYFLVCIMGFGLMIWVMFLTLKNPNIPPDSDDDEGGLSRDNGLPIIDLPPGGVADDLLIDRWHPSKSPQKRTF